MVFRFRFSFNQIVPWPAADSWLLYSEALPAGSEALPAVSKALIAVSKALTAASEALPAGLEALPEERVNEREKTAQGQ